MATRVDLPAVQLGGDALCVPPSARPEPYGHVAVNDEPSDDLESHNVFGINGQWVWEPHL